jgi:hypothetical protein
VKRITRELFEKHLGKQKQIKRLWWGGWLVDLESGASVIIKRKRIDFGKYRDVENRSDVEEWLFQIEVEACLALAQEAWGGIRLLGDGSAEDRVAMLEYAASAGINTGDQGLVLRHFGPEATIKYTRYGWIISLPNGSFVKFDCGAIEKVCGDMLGPALAMVHEIAPDNVVVRGKAGLVVIAAQHGRAHDIEVIAESDLQSFYAIRVTTVQLTCIAFACFWLDTWVAIIAGYIAGLMLCTIGFGLFWKQLRALARKRGLEMLGPEASVIASRKASIAAAKARGML